MHGSAAPILMLPSDLFAGANTQLKCFLDVMSCHALAHCCFTVVCATLFPPAFAVLPAGYAVVGVDNSIKYAAVSSWQQVSRIAPCPMGYYCSGGDPTNSSSMPVACPAGLNTTGTGASQLSDCSGAEQRNSKLLAG